MARYVFLFHDAVTIRAQTEADYRAILRDFRDWGRTLEAEGRLLGGHKLTDEPGRALHSSGGAVAVMDGPFAETKELIGGLVVVEADDYDHAAELATSCPQLKYGGRIEIRQIDEITHEQS